MLTEEEIVSTLQPLNGTYFNIEDLPAYARKWQEKGKVACTRIDGELASYVLYYDDGPEAFISMVWTHPGMQNRGHATALLESLVGKISKPIALEVDAANPARRLYAKLGFRMIDISGTRERLVQGRRVAIMQPYFFPYIGYFQLINAADLFVFYDDVHFIKRGRIHRNSILVNGKEHGFTVPIADASQNRLIMETGLHAFEAWRDQFLKQLTYSYKKAPFFMPAIEAIAGALDAPIRSIGDLAIASLRQAHEYLGVRLNCVRSSEFSPETRGLEKSMRLIEITKKAGGTRYINTIGGMQLYEKPQFSELGVALSFIKIGQAVEYRQYGGPFVPWLSIIDVMMFNSPEQIREMLDNYDVI